MDFARTPNELGRLADVRFHNALATEAHIRPTLEPTHRLLAKDARTIYSAPPASLQATSDRSAAARRFSPQERRPTLPALGRAHAVSPSWNASGNRATPSTGDIKAGKRITRGTLGRPRSDRDASLRPKARGPTLGDKLSGLSPSKQRAELLRHGFGETGGWWANEFIDLFDSVTPVLEFFHRRRRGVPFDLEDVFIAAGAIPGAGKAIGKIGRKAVKRSKSRRNVSGVATHDGNLPEIVEGKIWLKGSHRNAGKIPLPIAEKLAGRSFNNWSHFTRAFWREVAQYELLARQFSDGDVVRMKRGAAPKVHELQRVGQRDTYNIDHEPELQYGGEMYNMSGHYIRTPLNHVKGKR